MYFKFFFIDSNEHLHNTKYPFRMKTDIKILIRFMYFKKYDSQIPEIKKILTIYYGSRDGSFLVGKSKEHLLFL